MMYIEYNVTVKPVILLVVWILREWFSLVYILSFLLAGLSYI